MPQFMKAGVRELYESKFISYEEALHKLKSGDVISMGSYGNEPMGLLRKLHTVVDNGVEDLTVWMGFPAENYPFIDNDEIGDRIRINSIFYGGPLRNKQYTKRITFVPNNLHSAWQVMANNKKPNIFMATVTPMDRYGYVALSLSQQTELEMLDTCDLIILEVNPKIPYTSGTVRIPVSKVDYFIQADYPISTSPIYPVTPEQEAIANNVASLIHDGDTIQLGIGGLPDAVAEKLMNHNDLGIYTEMLGTAMGKLMWAGVVNNSKKNFYRNRTIAAFCWGSQELYNYVDDNPMIEIMPSGYVNDPFNIAKNDNFVSVNSALQIDLTGQVCSEKIGTLQYSGTGGAFDFAYGAYHAKNGRGIIAISSTAKGGTVSRIQPTLSLGAAVSISRNVVDTIVTEYGIARIRDCSIRQRVERLISIAHPDFRAELRKEADKLMMW